ncbi:hypothetical protein GPECTOR_5g68 [Gonium pectorale]|uniref:Protein kinase domain-containing protein n=1 Tax=Gonium pectorale TaxID=33097 RepID=A0A150GXE3_GONPE|nr:hypothetical protein GPECTOR_5g68 [Gonium pectorale]|eukprot:KXZ54413.1 hypothetical protein GPECTOR_5g68 [Gonium pectorale]
MIDQFTSAAQMATEDELALKLMPVWDDDAADAALLRELELLVQVCGSCRHVATLHGVTRKDGRLALVMRRYPRSLANELQGGRMCPGRVLRLAHELLQALADLHAHGVVAGPLNPDNVLLDKEGRAWLADVGMSRSADATAAAAGDFAYMAPEQFAAGEGVYETPQSDLWALGATLLYALTGAPPWQGLGPGQVGMYGRSPALPSDLTPALVDLLQRCLEPVSRERRPATSALRLVDEAIAKALEQGLAAPPAKRRRTTNARDAEEPGRAPGKQGSRLEEARTTEASSEGIESEPVPDSGSVKEEGGEEEENEKEADDGMISTAQWQPAAAATVLLPVHLVAGLHVSSEAVAEVRVPRQPRQQQDPTCGSDGCWLLTAAALRAATAHLPLPERHRRVLLRDADGGLQDVSRDMRAGATRGTGVQSLLLVDTRQPKPRVRVVVHGVEDCPTGLELELQVEHASSVEQLELHPDWSQHRRLFLADADGRARCAPWQALRAAVGGSGPAHLRAVSPPDTHIYVKTLKSETHKIPVSLKWTVYNTKRAIQDVEGTPPHTQRLICTGKQLEDDRQLRDYSIEAGATLHLMLRMRGGKPVICVWPSKPTAVTVRLRLSRHWSFSSLVPRPDRCDGGGGKEAAVAAAGLGTGMGGRDAEWAVIARPDGTLVHPGSGGREYAYLFWEALTEGGDGGGSGKGWAAASGLERSGSDVSCGSGVMVPGADALTEGAAADGAGGASWPLSCLGPTPPDLPLPDFDPARSFCIAGADVEA